MSEETEVGFLGFVFFTIFCICAFTRAGKEEVAPTSFGVGGSWKALRLVLHGSHADSIFRSRPQPCGRKKWENKGLNHLFGVLFQRFFFFCHTIQSRSGGVSRLAWEEFFAVTFSRNGAVLHQIAANVSLAVGPLDGDALVRLGRNLQVCGSIEGWKKKKRKAF